MNGSLGSEFIAFLDHIKDASEKCNQLFLEGSYDLENCKSPVHLKNGAGQGLQEKNVKRFYWTICMLLWVYLSKLSLRTFEIKNVITKFTDAPL